MAFQSKVGSFAWNSGTGSQAITGVGFQPKALIFFQNEVTADGYGAAATLSMGVVASSSQRGTLGVTFRPSGLTQGSYADDTHALGLMGAGGVLSGTFDIVSLDADGFTIDIDDLPVTANPICNYLALGGSDLTNAAVGDFALNTSTGAQAVTGVGFRPDCVIFINTRMSGAFPTTDDTRWLGLGWALSATARGAISIHDNNTNPTQSESMQDSAHCIQMSDVGATEYLVDLTSMDTDGFTLDIEDAPDFASNIIYLALKGGSYKVGAETQATSVTTKATTGVGFTPKTLLLAGRNLAAGGSNPDLTNDRFSFGAADGTDEATIWAQSQDAVASSNTGSRMVRTKVLTHSTSASTTNAEADMQSFDADGFTLNWTTADATAREFLYLAIGNGAPDTGLAWIRA